MLYTKERKKRLNCEKRKQSPSSEGTLDASEFPFLFCKKRAPRCILPRRRKEKSVTDEEGLPSSNERISLSGRGRELHRRGRFRYTRRKKESIPQWGGGVGGVGGGGFGGLGVGFSMPRGNNEIPCLRRGKKKQ